MHLQKKGARVEYREREGQRVRDSSNLSQTFPQLKSLTVDLDYHCPGGALKNRRLNYIVNLDNAKSVFRFSCPNDECIRGDFDLSKELADAIAKRLTIMTGEIICPGWQSKTTIGSVHCSNSLCYKLSLAYSPRKVRRKTAH